MNRFNEDSIPTNEYMRHKLGDDDFAFTYALNVCENCHRSSDRLTLVPEFNYMGCDDCMGEALAVIAREAKKDPQQARLFPAKEVA